MVPRIGGTMEEYEREVLANSAPDEITQTEVDASPSVRPFYWKRTDLGIAEEFVRRFGERLRRVVDTALKERDGFCWWSGTHWEMGDSALKQIWIRYFQLIEEARTDAQKINDLLTNEQRKPSDAEKAFLAFANSLESANRQGNFLTVLGRVQASSLWINIDRFDRDPMLLNFENGTVNLASGELQPHNPDDYITKHIPFSYDATASQELWLKFLGGVQSEAEISFLQRWCGYCATGLTTEKKFLVTLGKSNTGKSVYWNVLRAALGPYAKTASVATFEDVKRNSQSPSEDLADLRGVRLVVLPEPAENYRLSDALIKCVTGGDQLRARRMHENGFVYTPQFKAVYYTNYSLQFNGADTGMQTRYCEVGFNNVIAKEKQDEALTDKLLAQLPGVAAWIVQGAIAWRKDGLQPSDSVKAATESRLKLQDSVGVFLEEYYHIANPKNPDEMKWRVKVSDLYSFYSRDCKRNGRFPLAKDRFSAKLDPEQFPSGKVGGSQYRFGLSLKAEYQYLPPEEDEE